MTTQIYEMACMCGEVAEVEAHSREEALYKIWNEMDGKGFAAHMRRVHPGERVPSPAEVYDLIDEHLFVA